MNGCIRQDAPAWRQSSIPVLIACSTTLAEDSFPQKVQLLRCNQISQSVSIASDLMPFLNSGLDRPTNHNTRSAAVVLPSSGCILRASQSCHADRLFQSEAVNGHVQKTCSAVSRLRTQNWQKYEFGHPLRCKRSLHHNLFSIINQQKTFSFPGAHVFQMSCGKTDSWFPMNCAR